MYTETIRFEEVRRQFSKAVRCPSCGKPVRRKRTFSQTLNPWNRRKDGAVKTRRDIWHELAVRGALWQDEPAMCGACEAGS